MGDMKYTEKMEKRYKIGQCIASYRDLADETQQDLANLLKVSRQYISNIESGISNLPLDKAKIIADHYHIPVSRLLGDESTSPSESLQMTVYKEASRMEPVGMAIVVSRHYLEKQKYKNRKKEMVDKTYRLDNNVFGLVSDDLYAIEIFNSSKTLNVPAGSKAIVHKITNESQKPDFKKPTLVVLRWLGTAEAPEELGIAYEKYVKEHPVENIFISLVDPTKKAKYNGQNLIQYTMANETLLATIDELKEMCVGIVKKVVIDY